MAAARALGSQHEQHARRFLERHGLRILDANAGNRFGEIDIIAVDEDCVVFVEVRYRGINRFGCAAATVDQRKQRKLTLAAQGYLSTHPELAVCVCRFDVIGIDDGKISWLKDAFRP